MSALNLLLIVTEAVLASVALPPLAALLTRAFPKNAARRRLAWATMFAVLLALPLAAALSPSLAVIALHPPAPVAPEPMIAAVATPPTADPPLSASTAALLFGLYAWILGALWIVGRSLVGLARLHLLKRGAKRASPEHLPLRLPRGPHVLLSPECTGPVTWGVVRPIILLPDDALTWPQPKLEAALRHELAHVNARDCLMQTLALLACALYWPNPLVWRAADNLRREAEAAADDAVLASGIRPSDYASLLLDLANDWAGARRSELEMAMAAPPILTERVQSILSPEAQRTGATAMDTLKIVLLGGAATAALALARPSVAEVPATPAAPADAPQAAPAAPPADVAPSVPASRTIRSGVHDKVVRNTPQTIQLAQQDVAAPPALPAPQAAPTTLKAVPYNPVTDDPASPGYIPAGQPGSGHPVPANLAKLLNGRKDPSAPWNLTWIPNPDGSQARAGAAAPGAPGTAAAPGSATWIPNPNGPHPAAPPVAGMPPLPPLPAAPPGAVTVFGDVAGNNSVSVNGATYNFRTMTPEQRTELERKLAAIGPAVNKAIADAHVDETVRKALASQDPKTRELVAKQLADLGPKIERAVAAAHMQEQIQQRLAEIPQVQEAMLKNRARQADAEDQVAAQLEEQARRARERAKRDRDSLTAPQPAQPPKN